jgi:hypothetical protein
LNLEKNEIQFIAEPYPLDLYAGSYETITIYFFTGAIDFSIITFVLSLFSPFAFLLMPKVTQAEAGSMLSEVQSPRSTAFRGLLLLSFVLRAWRLGPGNTKRTCSFIFLQ